MDHIDLTPQTISKLGGFRTGGKTVEAALKLIDDKDDVYEALQAELERTRR